MRLLGLDPGTTETGFVVTSDDGTVLDCGVKPNDAILDAILSDWRSCADEMAVEMIASYGLPVGRETFETVLWIGRFVQAWGGLHRLVYRREVRRHLCGTDRAKDPHVRQALLDLYGGSAAVGTKKAPGPLYRVKSHAWSALAVAVTARGMAVAA